MPTTVTEKRLGRGGTRTVGRQRTYTRKFRVLTDDAALDTIHVRTLAGIPQINAPHPSDPTAFCFSITPDQPFEDKQIWEVTCEYKNLNIDSQGGNEASPTAERPKIRWTAAKFREPAPDAWIEGGTGVPQTAIGQLRALSNSRGQPFSPPEERDQGHQILTLTRREATFNPDLAASFWDTLNKSQITIAGKSFAKHTGKVESITAESAFENGTQHWLVTYEIHHDRRTWNRTLYDKAIDADGSLIFLNGQGIALEPSELANGTLPATQIARFYEEKEFSQLTLPATV